MIEEDNLNLIEFMNTIIILYSLKKKFYKMSIKII